MCFATVMASFAVSVANFVWLHLGWSSPCACQTLFLTAYPAGHFFVTFSEIRRKASFLFVIIPIFRNFVP